MNAYGDTESSVPRYEMEDRYIYPATYPGT